MFGALWMVTIAALGSVDAQAEAKAPAAVALDERLAGMVAGPPERCVRQHELRGASTVAGTAIIYRTRGSMIYVNWPKGGTVSQIDEDVVLSTRTTGGLLCANEQVELIDRTSGISTGFLILGEFVPYRRAR